MNESQKPIPATNSLLLLWLGSAGCAASFSFMAGCGNVLRVTTRYLTNGELEGGKGFAIGMPILLAAGVAIIGFTMTIVGFVRSLRCDGRRVVSAPHCIAFLSIALPLAVILIFR